MEEDHQGYNVVGIARQKLIFSTRPKPVLGETA
jgi:hypothetical protein